MSETNSTPLRHLEEKYEILSLLGEGGMGTIYKARHLLLDEVRVVKVMRSVVASDSTQRARFVREARSAIRLRHPSIAQLYDFNVDDEGTAYIVLEYIEGLNFKELLAQHGLPGVDLALELSCQALQALGFLHRQTFIHRDISPDNMMLTRDVEGRPLVKLIDLGLAKPLQDEGSLTEKGTFLGKVRYASPEQFGGHEEDTAIDARSDLYSFGVVLYELLTGQPPITGSNYSSLIAGHLFRPPLDFAISDPDDRVPPPLRQAVLKALAKQPDGRFASAEAFANQLAQIKADLGDQAAPKAVLRDRASWEDVVGKTVSRTPSGVGSGATLLRAAGTGGARRSSTGGTPEPTMKVSESTDSRSSIRRPRRWLLIAALALIVAGALAVFLSTWTPLSEVESVAGPAIDNGVLLLDAVPWAEVVAVTDANGVEQLTDPTSTPLALDLPAGLYSVTMRYPQSGESRTVTVELSGGQTRNHGETFRQIDVDRYFQEAGW